MVRTVLIVDDVALNREILKKILGDEYNVIQAADGREAIEVMNRDYKSISAVLLDLVMPVMDGFEVLSRMRESAMLSQLPVIIMTGQTDTQSEEKALELGANDYISKPYEPSIIKRRIRNTISLRETAATVNALQRDRLTGLYSREAFYDKAAELIASREPGYYIMACFDIDKFKVVNDQYGAGKGDEVLRYMANVFTEEFEPGGGICSRLYADDFAVLYPTSFLKSNRIERIHRRCSNIEGLASAIVFSVGRYIVDDLSLTPSAMYDRARLAANSIKGRYDVHMAFYDESMRERIIYEQEIVNEMDAALKERQFEVWFQPQYNHSSGALIGSEALVRWRHPQKGLISPGVFIPLFENNGFIYTLDKYVWEEVCRRLRNDIQSGRSPVPVSVNVSRYDVFRPDIIEVIGGMVEKYSIPVDLLRLEITESAFAKSTSQIVNVVKEFIKRGFTVEIDDFGSGYSSLNTLKDVPAQIIKLDMKFLESSNSQRGGNIVESVVRMAKWLGMSVIAEGVETPEQADYLRSIGCNYVQGYLYARPMPASEFDSLCVDAGREEKLLVLETVANLDNNAFWDPNSMDTLIFNSYVGGACIYEYRGGNIELLRATEKFAHLLGDGLEVADALKLNWLEYLDTDSRQSIINAIDESFATKKEVAGEYLFIGLPGCPRETYLRSTLRVIASVGERRLVYSTNENITAQRKAEQGEREVAERLKLIMANVNGGVTACLINDGNPNIIFANDQYYEQLGYTREQYDIEVNTTVKAVYPQDRARVVEEAVAINSSKDKKGVVTYRALRRDGTVRWVQSHISVINMPGFDDPVQLAVVDDVTERMEAERKVHDMLSELRERDENLQYLNDTMLNLMNRTPGGFVQMRLKPGGELAAEYCNDGFTELVGMDRKGARAIFGENVLNGVHPDDIGIVKDIAEKMTALGEAHNVRCRLRHGEAGYVWAMVSGQMTRDRNGEIILNAYFTDATEQINAEKQQTELLDNLPYGAALYEYDGTRMKAVHHNRRYWELVSREATTYKDDSFLKSVYPDDRVVVLRELNAAIRQKRDAMCDLRILCARGEYGLFHVVGRIAPGHGDKHSLYAVFLPVRSEAASYQQTIPVVLSAIMDSTTDLSFAKDADLRYICASRAFAKMAGLQSENDVVGKTDADLFDGELAEKYRKDDERVLSSGRSIIDMVEPIPSDDGVPHYSNTSKYILRDASGGVMGIYGIGRDVTKILENDSQLNFVNDSIPGGLALYAYTKDDVRIVYCNDGFCKLFGGTREGFAGRGEFDPMDWVFDEDKPTLEKQISALMQNDTPSDCVIRIHVIGGGFKWINYKAVAAERRGGTVLVNAVLLDVTRLQNAIEQLRISEEENSIAIRLGGSTICRYSVEDKSLTMAGDVAANLGISDTVYDVPYEPVRMGKIARESVDAYTRFFEDILSGRESGSVMFRQNYLKQWRWLEAKSSTIFSFDSKPVKAVISFKDVTDLLEKETVYKKWKQALKEKDPKSYSLYRCNVSKNTIVDSVEGLLLDTDRIVNTCQFDEHTKQYVEKYVAYEDAERYAAFLGADALLAGYYRGNRTAVLEYRERLRDGGFRWLRLTVDLVESPHSSEIEAYLLFEDIDAAKKAELATIERAEKDPLTGVLNRSTFENKVNKLIQSSNTNARHALMMLDLDGFKTVNDTFGHAAGDRTLIEIADSLKGALGRGDLVGRLGGDEFVAFMADVASDAVIANKAKQICALTRRSFNKCVEISGSLGLAVTPRDGTSFEELYRKADAALYYVKDTGKNSFIFFRNDMTDAPNGMDGELSRADDYAKKPIKRRMLIVDDSPIDSAFMSGIFADEYLIENVSDGNAAMLRLRHYGSAISIVLLDIIMPGMDGFAVLDRMRQSAETRSIPVVVVSGTDDYETSLSAIRSGAADFVTKPVDAELLRVRVRSAVSKAENERLRAKNSVLEYQNSLVSRYRTVLEREKITVIEHDWIGGNFVYDPSISDRIAGVYDERMFWRILLTDLVADTATVQKMQRFAHGIAADRQRSGGDIFVRLKTPSKLKHWFRMSVYKVTDDFGLTGKMYLAFSDLGEEEPQNSADEVFFKSE